MFHNYNFKFVMCFFASRARQASPEGRLSGESVAVLRFPECLLDGLLAAAPGPLTCPSRSTRPPYPSSGADSGGGAGRTFAPPLRFRGKKCS